MLPPLLSWPNDKTGIGVPCQSAALRRRKKGKAAENRGAASQCREGRQRSVLRHALVRRQRLGAAALSAADDRGVRQAAINPAPRADRWRQDPVQFSAFAY